MDAYEELMEQAREVEIFFKSTQLRSIPLITRSKLTHKVVDCPDRDEAVLRLAFFAAQNGFNAMIEVDVVSEKIKNKSRSYQQLKWDAVGVAAQVDKEKLARMDLLGNKG